MVSDDEGLIYVLVDCRLWINETFTMFVRDSWYYFESLSYLYRCNYLFFDTFFPFLYQFNDRIPCFLLS